MPSAKPLGLPFVGQFVKLRGGCQPPQINNLPHGLLPLRLAVALLASVMAWAQPPRVDQARANSQGLQLGVAAEHLQQEA